MPSGEIAKLYATIGADTTGLDRGFTKTKTKLQSLGGFAKTAGVAVVGGIGVATVALGILGKKSVDAAESFEASMATLSVAARGSDTDISSLHDAVLAMGADTSLIGISASGAAAAIEGLYKAGLTTSEIFGDLNSYLAGTAELSGAARAAADLQAASELDLAQASDIVTIAMKTFGLGADEAVGIADNFVKTADASVASVSGLAAALKNVGPTAAAFGWSLDDTNTALAVLSTRGIQGSEAGTALKSMMTNIMRPTKKVTETLDALGVSLYDAGGQMRSLPDIIGQLSKATAGLTEKQRNQVVQTLAGTFGMKAMNTLLTEGTEGWSTMENAIANASTVQEVAAARTNTLAGATEALSGSWESLKIEVGERALPVLTDMALWSADFITDKAPGLFSALDSVGAMLRNVFSEDTSGRIGLVRDTVMSFAKSEAWPFLMEQVSKVVSWFQENMPLIQETGQTLLSFWQEHIAPGLDNVWNIIKTIVGTGLSAILDLTKVIMLHITGKHQEAADLLAVIFTDVWEAIRSITLEFLTGIAEMLGTSLDEIKETWRRDWELAKTILIRVFDRMKSAVKSKMNSIKSAIRNVMNQIKSMIAGFKSKFYAVGRDIMNGLKDGIVSMTWDLMQAALGVLNAVWERIKNWLGAHSPSKRYYGLGRDIMAGMAMGIADGGSMVQAAMASSVQGIALPLAGPRLAFASSAGAQSSATAALPQATDKVSIQFGDVYVRNDQDIEDLAYRIASEIQRRGR